MTLTQSQQRKVEQNLGLVGKVIKDKVHNPGQNSIYSYDDLYQIGWGQFFKTFRRLSYPLN